MSESKSRSSSIAIQDKLADVDGEIIASNDACSLWRFEDDAEAVETNGEVIWEGDVEFTDAKLGIVGVCGNWVQVDASGGQGHCWKNIFSQDIPPSIREELEGEMLGGDGKDLTASNGSHYRWW